MNGFPLLAVVCAVALVVAACASKPTANSRVGTSSGGPYVGVGGGIGF